MVLVLCLQQLPDMSLRLFVLRDMWLALADNNVHLVVWSALAWLNMPLWTAPTTDISFMLTSLFSKESKHRNRLLPMPLIWQMDLQSILSHRTGSVLHRPTMFFHLLWILPNLLDSFWSPYWVTSGAWEPVIIAQANTTTIMATPIQTFLFDLCLFQKSFICRSSRCNISIYYVQDTNTCLPNW